MDSDDELAVTQRHDQEIDHAVLWGEWRTNGDSAAREQLIDIYLPFARMLAAKLYGRRTYPELEFHDYFQHASIGLLETIDRFDIERGIRFEPYAASRIKGAILSGIETLSDKQEQVTARKRILAGRIESLKIEETNKDDPNALFANLADIAIGLAMGLVLEDSGMYQGIDATYIDNTYHRIELQQLRDRVSEVINLLPRNERRVISYHYLQCIGFDEIANILGLSKGRISQIHKKALQHLSERLRKKIEVDLVC